MKIVTISNCKQYVADDKSVATEFIGPRSSNLKNFSVASITIPPGETVKKHYHILQSMLLVLLLLLLIVLLLLLRIL